MYRTLEALGVGKTWHAFRFGDRQADNKVWLDFLERKWPSSGKPADVKPITRQDLDSILYDFAAVTDIPPAVFWSEMMDAYPEAKIILVERDPEEWYKSFEKTIFGSVMSLRGWIVASKPFTWYTGVYSFRLINECFLRYLSGVHTTTELKQKAKTAYIEHNEAVREKCKKEGRPMLDYKLGSGLKPICDFLEIDVPKDVDFPNTNQADQTVAILRKIMGLMILGTAIDVLKKSTVVVAVGAVAWIGLRRPEIVHEWTARLFSHR